jgi:hypothetical protein
MSAHFPETTCEIGTHPTRRGASIDAHVSTDNDFTVLALMHPTLDDWLLSAEMALCVRALGLSGQ